MKKVVALFLTLFFTSLIAQGAQKTLDIYFIDVEGGAATLIVTPLGESMLIDSGFPEDRDAQRILHVVRDIAGLQQIDHCIITHWHRDHVGGITLLAKLIPVKNFYDHGLPTGPVNDINAQQIESYRSVTEGKSITLNAGDEIKFLSQRGLPRLRFRILASNGAVVGESTPAEQIKSCGTDFQPIDADKTDNANSLGMLLNFGDFKFFNGGDLTWNIENKLVCPKDLIGPVDVFQVNHHGAANSNNPTMVRALKPRVAIIGNGPKKGAEAKTYVTLQSVTEIDAIFQLHKNVATTWNENTASTYIANVEEKCTGEFIKMSVDASGRKYTVEIPAKNLGYNYQVK